MTKPDVAAGESLIEYLRLSNKIMVWMLRVNKGLCVVLTIYMAVFFSLLLGYSWLALAPTIIAAGYWIYLFFVTRLRFPDYILAPVKRLFQVIVANQVSTLCRQLTVIFFCALVPIFFALNSTFPESLHSPWARFQTLGIFLYILLLLIPQLYHSRELSKPVYSAMMADWLEKRFDTLPYHLAKSAAQGFYLGVAHAKGEPTNVFEEDVTPVDTVMRRYYTNMLVPYLPVHAFVFGLIAYAVTQSVSFANAGFPIGDFTVTAQHFLVIASIIIPFIAFIDFPFWLGQKEWKIESLGQLRPKLTQIKEKIEKTSECDKENRDQFEYALKMHKFYQEEIDKVTKISMHPYNFQVSLGVFVLGLISSGISQFVGSLLPPK